MQTAKKRRRKSILLVDDDRGVRSAITYALDRPDYELLEAPSPDVAASILSDRRDDIDLILLDVLLPGLSGPELANALIEADRETAQAPIIYITGLGQENLPKFKLPQNARLLHKPFAVSDLRKMVANTLSETGA